MTDKDRDKDADKDARKNLKNLRAEEGLTSPQPPDENESTPGYVKGDPQQGDLERDANESADR